MQVIQIMANNATFSSFPNATFFVVPSTMPSIMIIRDDNNTARFHANISGSICCRDSNVVKLGGHTLILCFFDFTETILAAFAAQVIITAEIATI